jgi:hypothetical protein
VLRGKTTEQLDRRLSLALYRQQAAGLDRQEQQAGTAAQVGVAVLIWLAVLVTLRLRHPLRVITVAACQVESQLALVVAAQAQSDKTCQQTRKLVMGVMARRLLSQDRL